MSTQAADSVCNPNSLAEQIRQLMRDRLAAGVGKKFIATNAYPLQPTAMNHLNAFLNGQKTILLSVADRIVDALGFAVSIKSEDNSDSDPNAEF